MSNGDAANKQHLDIRKYPNRRYYDATNSRHLTLEEIRNFIRDGYDVTVTESATGADITAQVLTQIILELETTKLETFSVQLLLRMIRTNDQFLRDFAQKYLDQALQAYLEYQKQLEERLKQVQQLSGGFSPLTAWSQMFTPFGAPFASTAASKSSAASGPEIQGEEELRASLSDLRRQVADLQQELAKAKKGRR